MRCPKCIITPNDLIEAKMKLSTLLPSLQFAPLSLYPLQNMAISENEEHLATLPFLCDNEGIDDYISLRQIRTKDSLSRKHHNEAVHNWSRPIRGCFMLLFFVSTPWPSFILHLELLPTEFNKTFLPRMSQI